MEAVIYEEQASSYIPNIDNGELTEEQRLVVRKMLLEEVESFSKKFQVDINLTDPVPVQRKWLHCHSPTALCRG